MLNKTWRTSNAKKAWAPIQEKGLTLNIRFNDKKKKKKKNCEQKVTQLWIMHLFAHQPWSLWVPYPALYGSPKDQPKTNWVLGFSSTKMDLFGISRGLQFWNLQLWWAMCKFVLMVREGDHFYRGEKEAERVLVNRESITFHWLSLC